MAVASTVILVLPPRFSVDVDDVKVLGEAIDEGGHARCAWEDRAPLLESEVGRQQQVGQNTWPIFRFHASFLRQPRQFLD